MSEFLKGWRRKFGVMTLAMACVFMAEWLRGSLKCDEVKLANGKVRWSVRSDSIQFRNGNVVCGVESFGGYLCLFCWTLERELERNIKCSIGSTIYATDADGNPEEFSPWQEDCKIEWRGDRVGFHFGVSRRGNERYEDYWIPYWSIVIPLSLISAYLLFSKPRTAIVNRVGCPGCGDLSALDSRKAT